MPLGLGPAAFTTESTDVCIGRSFLPGLAAYMVRNR